MAKTQALPLTEAEHTAVYRFFNAADELLYVGITGDPRSRWVQHAAEKAWWSDVVRHTVQWLPSREAALAAEAAAIAAEAPLHNVSGTPRHKAACLAFHGQQHEAANHPAVAAVRAALRSVAGMADAAEKARVTTALLREWPALHREVKEARQDAVDSLHQGHGWDFPRIARLIGTDRSRAWRIWKGMA
ncbi:GIY-YIG nuclease family protein [Streptomyces cellulosae]|nr:GIY-YIG nuclease family protein [Streptomyces cellulosae]